MSSLMPTRQAASCQQPGWPKTSKQQMCPRINPRSPKAAASRLTASTSHFGAVVYSAINSISDRFLISRSTTQVVCSFDWSVIISSPRGVRKRKRVVTHCRPGTSSGTTRHWSVVMRRALEPKRTLQGINVFARSRPRPMSHHPADRIHAETIEERLVGRPPRYVLRK